jgi:hypothetical protein
MLSSHYSDVGFAIENGRLPGDDNTVLVVEMFGSQQANLPAPKAPPVVAPSEAPTVITPATQHSINQPTPTPPPVLAVVKKQPIIDSAFITKTISMLLLSIFLIVFALDIIFTESRKTIRLAGHSFDHLLFLLGILAIAISLGVGIIE